MMRPLKDTRGSAIITAVVIGMIVLMLCLSALLVSYTLFQTANESDYELPVRELAYSAMDEIDRELCEGGSELNEKTDSLVYYIRKNLNNKTWEEGSDKYFRLKKSGGYEVRLTLSYADNNGVLILKVTVNVYEEDDKLFELERSYTQEQDWRWQHYEQT